MKRSEAAFYKLDCRYHHSYYLYARRADEQNVLPQCAYRTEYDNKFFLLLLEKMNNFYLPCTGLLFSEVKDTSEHLTGFACPADDPMQQVIIVFLESRQLLEVFYSCVQSHFRSDAGWFPDNETTTDHDPRRDVVNMQLLTRRFIRYMNQLAALMHCLADDPRLPGEVVTSLNEATLKFRNFLMLQNCFLSDLELLGGELSNKANWFMPN